MKLPRRLRIGNHRYDVIGDTIGLVGDHAENRGSTVNETLTIAIDARSPLSNQQETLLHEVLHACWDNTAISAHEVDEHQEIVVTALAPPLLAALRANPTLIDFLTGD